MARTALGTSAAITPTISAVNGHAVALSTDVASHFGKQHNNVLRDIDALLQQLPADRLLNFEQTLTERPNPAGGAPIQSRAYRLTRDGFTLLAMGFTGKKALAFKLAYLDAFNRMEAELASRPLPAIAHHSSDNILDKLSLSASTAQRVQRAMFGQLLQQRPLLGHNLPPELQALVLDKASEIAAQAIPHIQSWLTPKVTWGYNLGHPHDAAKAVDNAPKTLRHYDFGSWLTNGRTDTARSMLGLFDVLRDMATENAAALRAQLDQALTDPEINSPAGQGTPHGC